MGERETLPKRPRDEEAEGEEIPVEAKRHHPQQNQQQQRPSSFHGILSSLLEEEAGGEGEEGDISSLMTALQQELCSSSAGSSSPPPELPESGYHLAQVEECDVEGVMRRLLEASDDDLGIPPSADVEGEGTAAVPLEQPAVHSVEEEEAEVGGGGGTALLVENLETDAISGNYYYHYDYYTLLQPELYL